MVFLLSYFLNHLSRTTSPHLHCNWSNLLAFRVVLYIEDLDGRLTQKQLRLHFNRMERFEQQRESLRLQLDFDFHFDFQLHYYYFNFLRNQNLLQHYFNFAESLYLQLSLHFLHLHHFQVLNFHLYLLEHHFQVSLNY